MLHLEGFFNFDKKDKSWEKSANVILEIYKKLKNKDHNFFISYPEFKLPNAEILNSGDFDISVGLDHHLLFSTKNKKYEVINFNEVKDFKSDEGTYEISEKEWNDWKKIAQEISDWRDDISEKTFNKSNTTTTNLDFDELDLETQNLNYELNKEFSKRLQKEYEFEFNYTLWTSTDSNEKVDERKKVKFNKIEIELLPTRAAAKLFTEINGEKWYFWIEEVTNSGYLDLSKIKPWDKKLNSFIKVDRIEIEKSRKEKREEIQNTKYPYIISYEVVCSSWDSTELINDIKSILGEINRMIKK